MIVKSIFKSYDIRGIYPTELNKEAAYKIGQGFVEYTKAKKVVIGQDMRLSSPALFKSLTEGITTQGADVYNIGQVPTEGLYFAIGYYGYDAGIMITASHNPKEYNGFKMVQKQGAKLVSVIPGKDLAGAIQEFPLKNKGKIKKLDIWQDYLSHILSFIDSKKIRPFRIVIDASNGMAGKVIPKLSLKLPIKIIPLNFNLDGNFPAHPSNPLLEGVTDQISKEILDKKADFGFIFDGDADRIFLIDELGNFIKADTTFLLLIEYFLRKYSGKGVAFNVVCSKSVPEIIKKLGGKPIRTPVGFINLQKGLIENDGIVSGETSGHYAFRDNFYLDSGFITFLILLQMISETDKKPSEIIKKLSPYAKGAEINFKVKNKEKIIKKVREQFSDGKQDYLDGLTVEYKDWWFNVRASQTEPILRLTVEAKTEKLLNKKKKELVALIDPVRDSEAKKIQREQISNGVEKQK